MRIYLAADYVRKHEMRGCRDVIEALGHEVTSSWIDTPDHVEDAGIGSSAITDGNYMDYASYAKTDWNDIHVSDMLVLFTTGELTRGGRHTEFGLALAWGKMTAIVGPREHVFHCLPEVAHHKTWLAFVREFSRGWSG